MVRAQPMKVRAGRRIALTLLLACVCAIISRAEPAGGPLFPTLIERLQASPALPHAIADLDGDHQLDFITVRSEENHRGGSLYRIDLHLAGSAALRSFPVIARSGGLRIMALDVDGDHALDLVITTRLSNEPIGVWINDGHGSFSERDRRLYSICFLQPPSEVAPPGRDSQGPSATLPSRGSDNVDCARPAPVRLTPATCGIAGRPAFRALRAAVGLLPSRAPPVLS
jgi:hypothetical protein